MNTNRKNQIIESLEGLGTKQNTKYTNQEIINHLIELQGAMARGVFEQAHADNLRDRDIMIHFESLAKEYGLDKTDTYLRFKSNMSILGYTIGSLINGMKGERDAKRALKLLSFDRATRILYNVQLEDEDIQAEYDAIAITPYGMYVIEVKNWGTPMTIASNGFLTRNDNSEIVYDLPGHMSIKEALLREYLKDRFPKNHYHNILLFPNERAEIQDNYHKVFISCGGGISYEIKSYCKKEKCLSEEQISKIADIILSNHKVQYTLCNVKCEEIIADYAALMVQIEQASNEAADKNNDFEVPLTEAEFKEKAAKERPWFKRVNWGIVAANVLGAIVFPCFVTAVVVHRH